LDDASAPPGSCLFVSPDEPPFKGAAGADGVTLLLMQFPSGICSVDS
jgi:hypothetical protein